MDLYLLDESRTPIYIIDDYVSLVWTERFQEPGEFELRLKPTRYSFNDFVKDRFLVKSDSNDVMIIESREISNDFDEEGKFLDIKGRSVSSILGRRIDMSHCLEIICNGTYTYTGDVINVMNDIVNKNLINPIVQMTDYEHLRQVGEDDIENEFQRLTFYDKSAPNRKISELVLGPSSPSDRSLMEERPGPQPVPGGPGRLCAEPKFAIIRQKAKGGRGCAVWPCCPSLFLPLCFWPVICPWSASWFFWDAGLPPCL